MSDEIQQPREIAAKPQRFLTGRILLSQGIAWTLSLLCLVYVVRQVKLDELLPAIKHFNWHYLLIGIFSLAAGYAWRIQRWAVLLRAGGGDVTCRSCAAPFLGSIALNNVLPFRAGDIVRALIFPASLGVSRTTATASLVWERLIDLLTLLVCLATGLALSPLATIPSWTKEGVVTLTVIGSTLMIGVLLLAAPALRFLKKAAEWALARRYNSIARFSNVSRALLQDMRNMAQWKIMWGLFALSLLVWTGEAGFYLAFLSGLGLPATFATALMVMGFATLSTLLPSSPGYVGTFHLAAYTSVMLLGRTAATATEFAFLAHICLWSSTTLAGGIAILCKPNIFRKKEEVSCYVSSL